MLEKPTQPLITTVLFSSSYFMSSNVIALLKSGGDKKYESNDLVVQKKLRFTPIQLFFRKQQ